MVVRELVYAVARGDNMIEGVTFSIETAIAKAKASETAKYIYKIERGNEAGSIVWRK